MGRLRAIKPGTRVRLRGATLVLLFALAVNPAASSVAANPGSGGIIENAPGTRAGPQSADDATGRAGSQKGPSFEVQRSPASPGAPRIDDPARAEPSATFARDMQFWVLGGLGLLLFLALAVRVRFVLAHEALRLQSAAASNERFRIARDLHDTLLQSVQGVSMMMTAASYQLSKDHPVYDLLSRATVVANAAADEGRDAVLGLRTDDGSEGSLVKAVELLGNDLQRLHKVSFVLSVRQPVTRYREAPTLELVNMLREALTNAFRHSGASVIRCEITAARKRLVVVIADDGIGFEPDKYLVECRHFGVRGMYERAARIRADLIIDSAPGRGTSIVIVFRPNWFCWLGAKRQSMKLLWPFF